MMTFIGHSDAKLDVKGRVFIPAAFRKLLLSETVVVRKDPDLNQLVFYPEEIWNKKIEQLWAETNDWDYEQMETLKWYLDGAERLEMDIHGRTLIPKKFLQQIEAQNDVVFVGLYDRFTMESKESYDAAKQKMSDSDRARLLREKMSKKFAF